MQIRIRKCDAVHWGIYVDEHLVEGGFLTPYRAALAAAYWAEALAFTGLVDVDADFGKMLEN